jgi:hypothetical protein
MSRELYENHSKDDMEIDPDSRHHLPLRYTRAHRRWSLQPPHRHDNATSLPPRHERHPDQDIFPARPSDNILLSSHRRPWRNNPRRMELHTRSPWLHSSSLFIQRHTARVHDCRCKQDLWLEHAIHLVPTRGQDEAASAL